MNVSRRRSQASLDKAKTGALANWARRVAYHPWRVLGAALVVVIGFGVLSGVIGGDFSDQFTVPGVESQRAFDLLEERFPQQSGDTATIVFQVTGDAAIEDAPTTDRINALLTQIRTLPHVAGITSPFDTGAAYQISDDHKTAYATVNYDVLSADLKKSDIEKLIDMSVDAGGDGLVVEPGGQVVAQGESGEFGASELIGFAAAAFILLVAFGSVVAMGLPLLNAAVGLASGFMGIMIAARFLDISTFTPAFASMIGIGVGIDYSLFVVTRFREGLTSGLDAKSAAVRAVDTAGRAVIFAGSVVVIAMLGLLTIGIPFISAMGIAAAIVVTASIIVAVTILPAMLSLIGKRIDRWSLHVRRSAAREKGTPVGYRLARRIQANPLAYALSSAALLIVLALPILDIDLGFPDAGANPKSMHTRQAYDLLTEGFGPGFNAGFLIAVESDGPLDQAALDGLVAQVRTVPGVVEVTAPVYNEAGDTAVINVVPSTGANDSATNDLVKRLRDDTIPAALAGTNIHAYVGGVAAIFIDITNKMLNRTPYIFLVVIGLSFLLLTTVFRSPIVALKAAIMNLLSIAASFGVTLAVFQWGWGKGLVGLEEKQTIAAFMPMFLFAILFGLSMDYEVFLLSRIREAWVHGRSTRDAVADGLSVTARVITAAAAIMVCVFFSFILTGDPISKQFGFGLGIAILIDATVVRLILVPATMELLGDWNWWFPHWLDHRVPHFNIEGTTRTPAAELEPVLQPAD